MKIMSEVELQFVIEKYQEGMSVQKLSEIIGVGKSTIHDKLRKAGIPPRNPARSEAAKKKNLLSQTSNTKTQMNPLFQS